MVSHYLPSKENVEAAAEEAVVGSEEPAILRIGGVGVNVSRIEMVGEIEPAQRQPHAVLLRYLKLFGELGIKRHESGKTSTVRIAQAYEVLLCIPG